MQGISLEEPPADDHGADGPGVGQAAQRIAGDEDEIGLRARRDAPEVDSDRNLSAEISKLR